MGDPTGPGQHRGDGDDTGDHAPRHLPSTPPPGHYHLGYGSPDDGLGWGHRDPYGYGGSGGPGSYEDGVDDDYYYDDELDGRDRGGVTGSVQGLAAEAVWRYRSAPMRVRVIADLVAASLVLLLIVGVAIAFRQDGGSEQTTANTRPRPSTTVESTTTTTAVPTTTTLPPTTTTAPTTTTTAPPSTTTTAAPVVPPPTEAPTTTAPPETTTTTEAVTYRSCRSARSAGALPLFAGQPGYGEHLDSDRDGEACEDFDDWTGRG